MKPHRLLPLCATVCTLLAAGAALAAAVPIRQGDAYLYPDGTRVRALDPAGRPGQPAADGSIRYADGTVVTHDTRSGDTRVQRPDGRAALLAGRTPPPAGGSSFAFADGTRLRGTDVAGRPARLAPDGTVHYPDGTRATHDTRSGDTRFTAPDGTQRLINRRKSIDRTVRPPPGSARPPRPAAAASADPRYAGALLTLPPDALVTAPPVRGAAAPASAPRPIDPFATARR